MRSPHSDRSEPALRDLPGMHVSAPRMWVRLLAGLLALGVLLAAACAGGTTSTGDVTVQAPAAVAPAAGSASASPATSPPASPSRVVEATPSPSALPTGSPSGTAPPRPAVTAAPISTPATATFAVTVDPPVVGRGETLMMRVTGPTSGTVRAGGLTGPLFPTTGGAWAVVGVGLYANIGAAQLTVNAPSGSTTVSYSIVDPGRPADYLVLTEEQGSVLTPEAGAREIELRAQQFASSATLPMWRTAFRHPLLELYVTTPFGSGRSINGGPVGEFHSGQDLAADEGTPVMASAPGRVSWVGAMPIRGNSVIIDHGGGVKTGYHHLLDITVSAGQAIEAGATIGHVGSTGLSTGPHLHWELTIFGVNVDPETWAGRGFVPR